MNTKSVLLIFGFLLLVQLVTSVPYVLDDDDLGDYSDNSGISQNVDKRACIRRSGSCDHRPNDCCFSSACRCNLWGTNCRCQRAGLFQRWGK